ncbi:uncharacterized protein LOC129586745 isoform X2 [Paramacrobiotus metropolitanus]|uniref:uncharacterized protein LOC129586745 isoform X2 n=1 Tax=Paramacrobiotus metropolitanus TaxID=2943436 RepID=UPI002445FDC2|nr:uncharacterized protein LOC129586745 isoform X2 [Paramacrobiotus metropolitanus]
MLRWMRMKSASSMGSSGCWGLLNICVVTFFMEITRTLAAADATSSSFLSSLSQSQYPQQSRTYDTSANGGAESLSAPNPVLVSISSSIANQNSPVPFAYSSNGYSVPSGAVSLGRSYTGNSYSYSNPNSYAAYPSASYSQPSGAVNTAPVVAASALQASPRSFSPYGSTNNYLSNNAYSNTYKQSTPTPVTLQSLPYQTNIANYDLSYRSSDPAEPDDPADGDQTKKISFALPNPPTGFSAPNVQRNRENVGQLLNQLVDTGLSARTTFQTGTTEYNNGIGNNYAASNTPQGATYNGPAQSYARATGYGQDGYAQNSPNVASGSVYNPGYGTNSYPSYYGATNKNYGFGSFSAASLYPFYLYYPVEYGYDQGEQSVLPTGYFPLVGYKRRYGYRRGPFYGYGIYVDYPPYFGFGKVKDGWGSDPEADQMAAVALDQGAGASAAQSIYSSNGNSNAQQAGGYNPNYANNNGYGGNVQTTGYGATQAGGSYTAANAMISGQNNYNSASSYPTAYAATVSPTYQQNAQPAYSGQNYNSQQNNYMQNSGTQQNYNSNNGASYGTTTGNGGQAQYGSNQGSNGQTTNYMYNNYADPSQYQASQYNGNGK